MQDLAYDKNSVYMVPRIAGMNVSAIGHSTCDLVYLIRFAWKLNYYYHPNPLLVDEWHIWVSHMHNQVT